MAVCRESQRLRGKIGLIHIKAGDQLILSVGEDFRARRNIENNFYLVSNIDKNCFLSTRDSIIAVMLLLGAILISAMGFLSLFKALLTVL